MNAWDVLAIPSRGRHDKVVPLTINSLRSAGCDIDNIEIWVEASEADDYRIAVRGEGGITVRTYTLADAPEEPVLKLRVVRNLIADAYPIGTELVCSDDDIRSFSRIAGTKSLTQVDLPRALFTLRGVAAQYGGALFGLYPVANAYFMERRITTDLRYIVGAFFGYTVKGIPEREHVILDDKEDFERTLRFYSHDGAVVRADFACLTTSYYGEGGGMQIYRTPESVADGAARVHDLFPRLTSEPKLEKSGRMEVRLLTPRKGQMFNASGTPLERS